jgi:hypothetical protein
MLIVGVFLPVQWLSASTYKAPTKDDSQVEIALGPFYLGCIGGVDWHNLDHRNTCEECDD